MDIKFKKMDWTSNEVTINGRKLFKVSENKELDIYCYRREWKDTCGNSNHCFEIVSPIAKDRHYPGNEDFGQYGLCISKNDRYLQEKIEWYLANGLSKRYINIL